MSTSPTEAYVVTRLTNLEHECDTAHAILDMKGVLRAMEGVPRLTLAQRILALTGELAEIEARRRQEAAEASIDSAEDEAYTDP